MEGLSREFDVLDKLSFIGKWYTTDLERHFLINFFPFDESFEIYDLDYKKLFLARASCVGIQSSQMIVGNSIFLHGRLIEIVSFANEYTKNTLEKCQEHTCTFIKPAVTDHIGEIIGIIEKEQFHIINIKMVKLTTEEAVQFYAFYKNDPFLTFVVQHVCSGLIVVLEIAGFNVIDRWLKILGPLDPLIAKEIAPESLRAKYGKERDTNGFHISQRELTKKEIDFFFQKGSKDFRTDLTLVNTTCCIIKPHIIKEQTLSRLITDIVENFKILTMTSMHLTTDGIDEFLEAYKGLVSDYCALKASFLNGFVIVMEIGGKTLDFDDVHGKFKKFCGPIDPNIARQIHPSSLRAKFGVDKYHNAVYCTDLAQDTTQELEYFFKM